MTSETVMLLIDADNVSIDVVEQAIGWVHKHYGGPHVRRAYCTAESAVKHQNAFKRLGIRPMVNLAAGKNSTDIALAVDAIDLVVAERPQVVVIASSDSDFAPLVGRLREKGCRVVGIGQGGKVGDETIGVYDDFEVLAHRKPRAASSSAESPAAPERKPRSRGAAKTTRASKAAAVPDAAPAAPEPAPADSAPPAKKASRRRSKAAAAPAAQAPARPALPDKARAILAALPALARGETVELRVAAEKLREAGLLSRSGSSTKLFGQFPALFELQPPRQPNHVSGTDAVRG
jgi:uncharacterized protein (TIGR00288 family)